MWYICGGLSGVLPQRRIWHGWRGLAAGLTQAVARAARGLVGDLAEEGQQAVRQERTAQLYAVVDARSDVQAESVLAQLKTHPYGTTLAQKINAQFDRSLLPLLPCHRGLLRIALEGLWGCPFALEP